MINASNLVDEIRIKFPSFSISEEMDGLPTVIVGFLADRWLVTIRSDDNRGKEPIGHFINDMAESNDNIVRASLSEVIAVLYDNLAEVDFGKFVLTLSEKAQDMITLDIRLWRSQN